MSVCIISMIIVMLHKIDTFLDSICCHILQTLRNEMSVLISSMRWVILSVVLVPEFLGVLKVLSKQHHCHQVKMSLGQ